MVSTGVTLFLLLTAVSSVFVSTRASSSSFIVEPLRIGDACTDACDANVTNPTAAGTFRTFCGIDERTYNTTIGMFTNNNCYAWCGVAAQYVGLCGCPNDCGAHLGYGECLSNPHSSSTARCQCKPGFGGKDCMSVNCSSVIKNNCSGRGICSTSPVSGTDYCVCDEGYTGAYCHQSIFQSYVQNSVIEGIEPSMPPAALVTPLLNISVFGTMRLDMDEDDFKYLIDPLTVYNSSRKSKKATLWYTNGNNVVEDLAAKIQVKGATSRLDFKKGWKLSFDAASPFLGVISVGLKSGNAGDDSMLKPYLMGVLGRALGLSFPRTAMTVLYINGVFMGLYFFDESVDDTSFLTATFGTDSGPIVKLTYASYLQFLGWNATVYEELGVPMFRGSTLNFIETNDWTAYMDLVYFLSLPNVQPEYLVDVDSLIRTVALEAFALDDDHFLTGNNYYLYRPGSTNHSKWIVVDHDFDTEFAPKHGAPVTTDVMEYPLDENLHRGNPLVVSVFSNTTNLARYREVMRAFVDWYAGTTTAFESSFLRNEKMDDDRLKQPSDFSNYYANLAMFVYPWVEADIMQQFAFSSTPGDFSTSVITTMNNLFGRAFKIAGQIAGPTEAPSTTTTAPEEGPLSSKWWTADRIGEVAGGASAGLLLIIIVIVVIARREKRRRAAEGYYNIVQEQPMYL